MFLTQCKPGTRFVAPDVVQKDGETFRLPRTNVNETESDFVLTMEMPGVDKSDVDVSIENDKVVITGQRSADVMTEGLRRREIRSDKFSRSFTLDNAVDVFGRTTILLR